MTTAPGGDEPLVVDTVATAARLRALRRQLRDWAQTVGYDNDTVGEIELAGYEALSNVAEHAYPVGAPAPVQLIAVCGAAVAEVQVSDQGRWRPPARTNPAPGATGSG